MIHIMTKKKNVIYTFTIIHALSRKVQKKNGRPESLPHKITDSAICIKLILFF